MPYRCLDCRSRFFRPHVPWSKPPEAPPPAPTGAKPEPEQGRHAPAPDARETQFESQRSILILDGDPAIRKLLRRLLERGGYFVSELAEVKDLLRELRSRRVDLLIADFGSPRQQELETMTALERAHPDLKVIGLTSQPIEASQASATWLLLPKPFHSDALIASVHRLLEHAAAGRLPIQPGPPEVGLGHAAL